MRPGHCIHEHGKETFPIQINGDHSNMSLQSEADQLLSYALFPDPRIGLL